MLIWLSVFIIIIINYLHFVLFVCSSPAFECNCYSRNFPVHWEFSLFKHISIFISHNLSELSDCLQLWKPFWLYFWNSVWCRRRQRKETLQKSSLCLFQSVIISLELRGTLLRWGVTFTCAGGRNANWVIWFGLNEEEQIV